MGGSKKKMSKLYWYFIFMVKNGDIFILRVWWILVNVIDSKEHKFV